MFDVSHIVKQSTQKMHASSLTPRRDVELLLAYVLQRPYTWLFAHAEYVLTTQEYHDYSDVLQRALSGEPIAYILGSWGFGELELEVNPAVLIPRPETECLVEWILRHCTGDALTVLDLGTGSGAIALALAHARPQWDITAVDLSADALAVAKRNAERNRLTSVTFTHSDWFSGLSAQRFDVIVSNPPYIAADDPHLEALTFEPASALVSGADGLVDIAVLLHRAQQYLVPGGCVVIEHGYDQAAEVASLALAEGFVRVDKHTDLAGNDRFIVAFTES